MIYYKIYRKDNYLHIVPTSGGNLFQGVIKKVIIVPVRNRKRKFTFKNVERWDPLFEINVNQILDENGDAYSLSEWESFYKANTGNFNEGDEEPFDPSLYDLSLFKNEESNPFATMQDVINSAFSIPAVTNFSALPDPLLHDQEYYRTTTGENSSWRPQWLGGTYYPEGIYQAVSGVWDYAGEFPFQADLATVNAGTNNTEFITPYTLTQCDINTKFTWTLDFMDGVLEFTFRAPNAMQIDSVIDINSTPTTTITKNAAAYTLGSSITVNDEIKITVSIVSVIQLNITKL